jgi:hypothetical protein
VQIFVSRFDAFLGTELFAADVPIIVGRHRDAHLRLKDERVSRRHLQIKIANGALLVEDLGSGNGTLVNRRRIAGSVKVHPSDAIQIGPYTIRLRPLMPRTDRGDAASGVSDEPTKIEAVLSADGSNGTEDSAVPIPESIDWRIYEDAIRRATGGEPARNVIHLRVVAEEDTSQDEDSGLRWRTRDEAQIPRAETREPSTARDLPKAPQPKQAPEPKQAPVIFSEDTNDPVWAATPSPDPANIGESHRFQIVPSQHMLTPERDALEETKTTDEADFLGKAGLSKKDVKPVVRIETKVTPKIPSEAVRPSFDRARSSAVASDRPRIPARLVTPATEEKAKREPPKRKTPPPPPPVSHARVPVVTHAPPPPPTKPSKPPQQREPKSALITEPATKAEEAKALEFDAIEISARSGDRLLDVARLRRPNEQYVLGHRTPQGAIVPHSAHAGLRLLRLTPDRKVDLVFPVDVAGHLVRDRETVMLRELTEGRKYSCLRLKTGDVATVIVGSGSSAISYHIRFIRVPQAISTASQKLAGLDRSRSGRSS